MKILVLYELFGRVRDACRQRGHEAFSCDLYGPDDYPEVFKDQLYPNYHYEGDAFTIARAYGPWDLIIAHPPCQYLTNAGSRWLYQGGKGTRRDLSRWAKMEKAAYRFSKLYGLPTSRLAIENPVMHGHGLEIIGRRPTQIIQPYQFGHGEIKKTCLWLKGLPPLEPTRIVSGRRPRVHHESPGVVGGLTRSQRRSITYQGIADAMAEQWGNL